MDYYNKGYLEATLFLFVKDSHILVEHRPKSTGTKEIFIPNGRIDTRDLKNNNYVISAMKREISEEFNKKIKIKEFVSLGEFYVEPLKIKFFGFLVTKWTGNMPKYTIEDNKKFADLEWININEHKKKLSLPSARFFVERATEILSNTKIYLLRHAKPEIINNEFFKSHLSKEGKEATIKLAKSKIIPKPDIIYVSPYNRTIDTAKIFSKIYKIPIKIQPEIREWNLQSLNHPEYSKEELRGWLNHSLKVSGGESLNDVKKRMINFLKYVSKQPHKNILIVGHGTAIELVCSYLSETKSSLKTLHKATYLEYAIIEYTKGEFKLIKDIIKR